MISSMKSIKECISLKKKDMLSKIQQCKLEILGGPSRLQRIERLSSNCRQFSSFINLHFPSSLIKHCLSFLFQETLSHDIRTLENMVMGKYKDWLVFVLWVLKEIFWRYFKGWYLCTYNWFRIDFKGCKW